MPQKIKIFVIVVLSILLGFFAGYQIKSSKQIDLEKDSNETHQIQSNYKYISPLLVCGNPVSTTLLPLKEKVNLIIKDLRNISHISVYFRDLQNGPWFGINENELFSPASLVKVPLAIAFYKQAQSDPDILNQKIVNTLSDFNQEQNIKPEKTITPNQEYTVQELIEHMIIYSDNNSYDLLSQYIDNQILKDVYFDLGIDIDKALQDPSGNIISVRNYASFFRILFNTSYLNYQYSNQLLQMLTQTTFRKGIVAGVGHGVDIAHKFGERQFINIGQKQLHDCGVVYYSNKPYLLCIMTRGNNFDDLSLSIKTISTIIHSYWTSL